MEDLIHRESCVVMRSVAFRRGMELSINLHAESAKGDPKSLAIELTYVVCQQAVLHTTHKIFKLNPFSLHTSFGTQNQSLQVV